MRILHVINRVFVVFAERQINVKDVFGIGLAAKQEETHRIGRGPLDQIAQCHIAARSLGNLDFFACAYHAHHGVQHVVWVALRYACIGRLQAGAHAGNRAVMIHALNIDSPAVTTLPFGEVVGHIRHKIGVAAVAFSHHAVFVVIVVG